VTDAPDAAFASAGALRAAYRARSLSPVEVVETLLRRLETFDAAYRTHVTVCADQALDQARRAERELLRGGGHAALFGVPVSHKDNLWTRGVRTGVHSRTSFAQVPTVDATAVARLRSAGAILLGKTNTTEFACGDMLEHGDTPNPWDAALYSGASSAGSASAVAAGLTTVATGSDTGGSIRAPAALCGIVGVKPTYGRVSRFGLVPLSWSMDHVGPMARTVADAATMLEAMAGHDPRDPTSSSAPVGRYRDALREDLRDVRLGIASDHYAQGLEPAVEAAFVAALEVFRELGARVQSVRLPSAGQLAGTGTLLSMWEAFALHAATLRREGRRYGPKARAHLASGAFHAGADVALALQLRTRWAAEFAGALAAVDAFVAPTLPFTAVTRDAWVDAPPDTSWGTRQFNLSGHPALTLPCGADDAGRPVALQVVARHFDEATMLRVAHAFECATPWHARRPSLVTVAPPLNADAALPSLARGPVAPEVRAEAERQALPLDEADLARVSRIVISVRDGLAALRLTSSSDAEPSLRFVAPTAEPSLG
jgi:aspartyl-tRNA(Asn)/glutamyl-tRNA(Gln) amidotransferase subunit A